MKKQSKKVIRKPKQKSSTSGQSGSTLNRRTFLKFGRVAAIAVPVLGVAGYFSVQSVQATICEADLSKIGNGRPAIVQIHDPNCPVCRTLQKQSRKALKSFEDGSFEFLVANIKTAEGGALAANHGVPHVTLLLFDGRGEMVQIVRGTSSVEELREIFGAHLGVSS